MYVHRVYKENFNKPSYCVFFSSYILLLPSRLLLQTMRNKQANKQRFLDGKPHFFCSLIRHWYHLHYHPRCSKVIPNMQIQVFKGYAYITRPVWLVHIHIDEIWQKRNSPRQSEARASSPTDSHEFRTRVKCISDSRTWPRCVIYMDPQTPKTTQTGPELDRPVENHPKSSLGLRTWRTTLEHTNKSLGTQMTQHLKFGGPSDTTCWVRRLRVPGGSQRTWAEALAWHVTSSSDLSKFDFGEFYMG